MVKVAFKGLAARKQRAFTLVVAVFLGVALVSGSYVLTDTINESFEDIFDVSFAGTDVAVTPKEIVKQEDQEPPPFDASLLDERQAGRRASRRPRDRSSRPAGSSTRTATRSAAEFAPNFVASTSTEPFDVLTYEDGRRPTSDGEAAIDPTTADRGDLEVGDTVARRGRPRARGVRDRRHRQARRDGLRRRGDGHAHAARGPAGRQQARTSSTRSRSRPRRASSPWRCAAASGRCCPRPSTSARARRAPRRSPRTSRTTCSS